MEAADESELVPHAELQRSQLGRQFLEEHDGQERVTRQEWTAWSSFKQAEISAQASQHKQPPQQVKLKIRPPDQETVFPCGKHPEYLGWDLKMQALNDLVANCINDGTSEARVLVFASAKLEQTLYRCLSNDMLQEMNLSSVVLDSNSENFPELDSVGPVRDVIAFVRQEPHQVQLISKFVQQHAIAHRGSRCLYSINFVTYMDPVWKKMVEQTLKPCVNSCKVRLRVREFDMGFVPVDVDILSLEMPNLIRDLKQDLLIKAQLNQPGVREDPPRRKLICKSAPQGSCHNAIKMVARALGSIEGIVKPFHRIIAKGDLTKEVLGRLKAERKRSGIVCGDCGGFGKLVVVDRYVDLVGAMLTGYTYGAMVLESYGGFDAAQKEMGQQDWPKGMQLNFNSNDNIWVLLRDLPMLEAQLICQQWMNAIDQVQRLSEEEDLLSNPKLLNHWIAKKKWANELINTDGKQYGTNLDITRKEVIVAHFTLVDKILSSWFRGHIPQSRPASENPLLYGEGGLVPQDSKFSPFWRDYVQKTIARNMLHTGRLLDPGGDSFRCEALSTESFKLYLQHCIERKPGLVAHLATGANGARIGEALRWLVTLSQSNELTDDLYSFFKARAAEFDTRTDVLIQMLEHHGLVGTCLADSSTKQRMNWIQLAISLNCAVHAVDQGADLDQEEAPVLAGQDLKNGKQVVLETGIELLSYPYLENWIDPRQFLNLDQDLHTLEWPPSDVYDNTQKEPWFQQNSDKPGWDGCMVPPERETCTRKKDGQLVPTPIPNHKWTDELLARPCMLVVPPMVRIIQAALQDELPHTDSNDQLIPTSQVQDIGNLCEGLKYDYFYNPVPKLLAPPAPPDGDSYDWKMNPPPRMVLFLGGCTMAEIAAVRVLARKGHDQGAIMILTTGIITGDDVINSFDMSWDQTK